MKLVNNNISPLPFYDNINLQNHRKSYAFGQVYPLITYRNMLLPFQVILSGGSSIGWVHIYNFNTGAYIDISTSIKEAGLTLKSYVGFKVLKYPGILPIVEIKHEGYYYLAIQVNGLGIIYSDIFSVTNRVDDYLLLEYSNSYNFEMKNGMVDFSDNFKFKCYLDTQIGRPEYNFEEEATERMGYSFIESQVSKKIYKFIFIAPEYLCDALRIVRLCDIKQITSKEQIYDLTTFTMEPDWEDQGDLASVECEFETDTVIANIGGYAPSLSGGDFNRDYNRDFDRNLASLITNVLNVSHQNASITATYPLASNLQVYIKFIDIDGEEFGMVEHTYNLSRGKKTFNIEVYQENIGEMRIVGTDYDDTYKYMLNKVDY